MKKTLVLLLLLISLVAIGAKFINQIPTILGVRENAGVRIFSNPDGADVYIDNKPIGKTPFQNDDLDAKEINIKIQGESIWEGKVKLGGHTITFVNRSLDTKAGEILTLEKGMGAAVISSPAEAQVEVDGNVVGRAPGAFDTASGDHTFVISHEGFLNRNIKATIPAGYKLIISVDLASSGEEIKISASPTPSPSSLAKVVVSQTPTGFLRVRDAPSTSGKELTQVKPGDELEFIEVSGTWTSVKLSDGTKGYVSSQYVTKK